jgi:hypothetical protein
MHLFESPLTKHPHRPGWSGTLVIIPSPFHGVLLQPIPATVTDPETLATWQECQEDERRIYLETLVN